MHHTSLPDYWDTNGKKTVVVSIRKQQFGAYDSYGYLVRTGRVSTAKRGYSTKRGTFRSLEKAYPELPKSLGGAHRSCPLPASVP